VKAYLVIVTFEDGSKEGVVFTDKQDAYSALNGCETGSTLACLFTEYFGEEVRELLEIEI
jgi:hypothetical protein